MAVSYVSLLLKLSTNWRRLVFFCRKFLIFLTSHMCRNCLASPHQSCSPTFHFTGDLMLSAPNLTKLLRKRKKLFLEKGLSFSTVIVLQFEWFSHLFWTLSHRWECISSESSQLLLRQIQPKLVLSGFHKNMAGYCRWSQIFQDILTMAVTLLTEKVKLLFLKNSPQQSKS